MEKQLVHENLTLMHQCFGGDAASAMDCGAVDSAGHGIVQSHESCDFNTRHELLDRKVHSLPMMSPLAVVTS